MAEFVSDPIDIEGWSARQVAVSGQATQTGRLREGVFDVWCDVACFIKVGEEASDVTASSGYPILANNVVSVFVRRGRRIGAITGGSSGTFSFHRVL